MSADWHQIADERAAEIVRLNERLRWLRQIDNAEQHERALEEARRLIDLDPKPDTEDSALLGALAVLVEAYEKKAHPITLICPACGADYAEATDGMGRSQTTPPPRHGFAELEVVRLRQPVTDNRYVEKPVTMPAGSVGTIVHIYANHVGNCEVEFTNDDGKTVAVVSVPEELLEKV